VNLKPIVATVCYLLREKDGTLGEMGLAWKEPTESALKLRVANRWNGWGGKVELSDSSIEATALRELRQESGVIATLKQIEKVGIITYRREGARDCICHIYLARVPNADPRATPEMTKPTWFLADELPYESMMASDLLLLPSIVAGKKVTGVITYDQEMIVIFPETNIEVVSNL
jgi:8-oxo-dGTP pyrophosphatase MutT (NUDIX family)